VDPVPSEQPITIRVAVSSYLALSGIWVIFFIWYLFLSWKNPSKGLEGGAAIAGSVTLMWWCWLFGFKITITKSLLEYRDGFFNTSKIPLSEIGQLKTATIEWNVLGRKIRVPRLIVISRVGNVRICINHKLFGMSQIQKIYQAIAM